LECPEERDYFPYWSPSPWRDIAVLTDHPEKFCNADGTYNGASQNNQLVYKCEKGSATDESYIKAITQAQCTAAKGAWTAYSHNIPAPVCAGNDWSRVNHLGNGRDGVPLTYAWTLPTLDAHIKTDANGLAKCVLRMRYNISTDDYNIFTTNSSQNHNPDKGIISPVTNNPTVDVGGPTGLRLAINTAQFGRTFQDRSHIFYIAKRQTSVVQNKKIYNLNVRGKRGNIVQTYPAVEYDFVPNLLTVSKNDLIHLQWTGSNTHNNGDPAGDGQAGDLVKAHRVPIVLILYKYWMEITIILYH